MRWVKGMLNIAVIEDNDRDAKILEQCLTRYATQNHLQFQVAHFSSALKFINAYKSNYDLIFMDIEMPLMSGMEAAKALSLNFTFYYITLQCLRF